ncbi:MAG: AAA-like domain-containing protein [Bacteroidota bacterium]
MKRIFNTFGANNFDVHYTLERRSLIDNGIEAVKNGRFLASNAPPNSGKSTYLKALTSELRKQNYKVANANFKDYQNVSIDEFLAHLLEPFKQNWGIEFKEDSIHSLFDEIEAIQDEILVLIIDNVEDLNKEYVNDLLHSIRRIYHTRKRPNLESVILIGAASILDVSKDGSIPFNIADNLSIPFFTDEETFELLSKHERATGQLFEQKVKEKIVEITANQPGLVNGFAQQLIVENKDKPLITYQDYLEVENWYINISIDKNVANILNKAKQYRSFVERLLFTETKIEFQIDRPAIKTLHTNGLITWDEDNNVIFWVPLYQKKLFTAFYPYTNGEAERISSTMLAPAYLKPNGRIDFDKLIDKYKKHIQTRSFRAYREKDEQGNFKSIREAAMLYSFETFIGIFIQEIEGKSYREAFVSLGNVDLIINVKGIEYLIETKKYYSPRRFVQGKQQLAYYCSRKGISEGIYIVFIDKEIQMDFINEDQEVIEGIGIKTYLIRYDEQTDFGEEVA